MSLNLSTFSRENDGRRGGGSTQKIAADACEHPFPPVFSRVLLWLALPLLAGCANPPLPPIVTLSPNVTARLPRPPAPDAPPVHREQLLTATARGETRTLHVVLDIAGGKMRLAGLSPVGIRLFTGTYDGDAIIVEQIPAATGLPPAGQVLGDIMLSGCAPAEWASTLPAGWVLADDPGGLRRVLKNPEGAVVSEIFYTPVKGLREPVRIRNHRFDYEIKITNIAGDGDDDAN